MFFVQSHELPTSVDKLPDHDEILNKSAHGNDIILLLYFLSFECNFSPIMVQCVWKSLHLADLGIGGLICPSPVSWST